MDDGRTTDAGVIGILIAHLGTFGLGELKIEKKIMADLYGIVLEQICPPTNTNAHI